MKRIGKILSLVFSAFIIIFSIIFLIIESRTLFSLDWTLYENTFNGMIRYLFRVIISLFGLLLGIFTYIALLKKYNQTLHIYLYVGSITFLISSIIIAIFASNYLDILFFVLPLLYSISIIIYYFGNLKIKSILKAKD